MLHLNVQWNDLAKLSLTQQSIFTAIFYCSMLIEFSQMEELTSSNLGRILLQLPKAQYFLKPYIVFYLTLLFCVLYCSLKVTFLCWGQHFCSTLTRYPFITVNVSHTTFLLTLCLYASIYWDNNKKITKGPLIEKCVSLLSCVSTGCIRSCNYLPNLSVAEWEELINNSSGTVEVSRFFLQPTPQIPVLLSSCALSHSV